MHTEFALDIARCWTLCNSFEGCNWYSFDIAKDSICQMFETCPEIESNWLFVSGQKECEYDTESGEQHFLPILFPRLINPLVKLPKSLNFKLQN